MSTIESLKAVIAEKQQALSILNGQIDQESIRKHEQATLLQTEIKKDRLNLVLKQIVEYILSVPEYDKEMKDSSLTQVRVNIPLSLLSCDPNSIFSPFLWRGLHKKLNREVHNHGVSESELILIFRGHDQELIKELEEKISRIKSNLRL